MGSRNPCETRVPLLQMLKAEIWPEWTRRHARNLVAIEAGYSRRGANIIEGASLTQFDRLRP